MKEWIGLLSMSIGFLLLVNSALDQNMTQLAIALVLIVAGGLLIGEFKQHEARN